MLNGDGNEDGNKINRSISKKTNLHVQPPFCTFLCRCFGRLQCRFARLKEELPYVLTKNLVACVRGRLYFFHYRSFSPCLPLLADREHF